MTVAVAPRPEDLQEIQRDLRDSALGSRTRLRCGTRLEPSLFACPDRIARPDWPADRGEPRGEDSRPEPREVTVNYLDRTMETWQASLIYKG